MNHCLTDTMKREVIALIAQFGANRRGIVTGYQPQPPMVKVQLMPAPETGDPIETGWVPYKTWAAGLAGTGWRVVAPPQAGQQVLLICEEADGENYTAWGGYYSDEDSAPSSASAGEILLEHQSGSMLYLTNTGTITIATAILNITGPAGGTTTVNINGSLNLTNSSGGAAIVGNVTIDGTLTVATTDMNTHTHGNVQNGGGVTGPPIVGS